MLLLVVAVVLVLLLVLDASTPESFKSLTSFISDQQSLNGAKTTEHLFIFNFGMFYDLHRFDVCAE